MELIETDIEKKCFTLLDNKLQSMVPGHRLVSFFEFIEYHTNVFFSNLKCAYSKIKYQYEWNTIFANWVLLT